MEKKQTKRQYLLTMLLTLLALALMISAFMIERTAADFGHYVAGAGFFILVVAFHLAMPKDERVLFND